MKGVLLLILIATISCTNYNNLYECMNKNSCLDYISKECNENDACWNDLAIRNTCLLQNNCNFTADHEKQYNWECWHCWVGLFTESPMYQKFVSCVDKAECSQNNLTITIMLLITIISALLM